MASFIFLFGCGKSQTIEGVISDLNCSSCCSKYINEGLEMEISIPTAFRVIEEGALNDRISGVSFADRTGKRDNDPSTMVIGKFQLDLSKIDSVRSVILNMRKEYKNFEICSTGELDIGNDSYPYTFAKYDNFNVSLCYLLFIIERDDNCFYSFEAIVKDDANYKRELNYLICSLKTLKI